MEDTYTYMHMPQRVWEWWPRRDDTVMLDGQLEYASVWWSRNAYPRVVQREWRNPKLTAELDGRHHSMPHQALAEMFDENSRDYLFHKLEVP